MAGSRIHKMKEPTLSSDDGTNEADSGFRLKYDRFCVLLQRAARLCGVKPISNLRISNCQIASLCPIWTLSKFGAMRQKDLAEHIGVEGNSLVRILDDLEREKLAVRHDDPADRRAKLVSLTSRGKLVARDLEAVHRSFIIEMLSGSDKDEVYTAFRVLSSIIEKANSGVIGQMSGKA